MDAIVLAFLKARCSCDNRPASAISWRQISRNYSRAEEISLAVTVWAQLVLDAADASVNGANIGILFPRRGYKKV